MARNPAKRSPSQKPSVIEAQKAEDGQSGVSAEPRFDVTKVEGFVPIEQLKHGWTWPDYDPDNPEHERAARELADLLWRVQKRLASERRARAEAEAIAAEPKFVRVRRASKKMLRARRSEPRAGRAP